MDIYKPNLVLPLASSYNERGVNGFTTTFTNNVDQRKVNSWYEIASNSLTGKRTVYLSKRPGGVDSGVTLQCAASDIPYLMADYVGLAPAVGGQYPVVFVKNAAIMKACRSGVISTIFDGGGTTDWEPAFVDSTMISDIPQIVVQFRREGGVFQRAFYSFSGEGSWTEITDNDFDSVGVAGKMEHLDGYAFAQTTFNNIINSGLNTLDTWDPNNRIAKSIKQDYPAGMAKCGQILLAFGDESVEGFVNAGNPSGSPLRRVPELATDVGLGTISGNARFGGSGGVSTSKRHYYATIGKKIYFVGRRASSPYGQSLYEFNGSQFNRVSNDFIDKIISGSTPLTVNAITLFGKTAISIGFDGPSVATQRWLMFFPEWNDWFEWNSAYFQPVTSGEYFIGIANVSATKMASFTTSSAYVDGVSSAYTMTHQFKLPSDGASRKFMPMCGVVGDTARAASSLGVSFSDDDDQNFSTPRNIDMTGPIKALTRCGSYRERTVRLTHTGNVECRLMNFIAKT